MKILLFTVLIVCVVAIFALPQRSSDVGTQGTEQQLFKDGTELENDNQDDDSIDNSLVDNSISSNGTTTRRHKYNCGRRQQNGHDDESHGTNTTNSNQKRCRHRLSHVYDSLKLTPIASSDDERKHFRDHHHRDHHHHHKNRTTATPTTTSAEIVD